MPASIRALSGALSPCQLLGTTLACASTFLPELEIHSGADADDPRVKEVSTAAARDVPQTIDSIKTGNLTRYGASDLAYALTGLPNVSDGATCGSTAYGYGISTPATTFISTTFATTAGTNETYTTSSVSNSSKAITACAAWDSPKINRNLSCALNISALHFISLA
jgi:hypothetical protein